MDLGQGSAGPPMPRSCRGRWKRSFENERRGVAVAVKVSKLKQDLRSGARPAPYRSVRRTRMARSDQARTVRAASQIIGQVGQN